MYLITEIFNFRTHGQKKILNLKKIHVTFIYIAESVLCSDCSKEKKQRTFFNSFLTNYFSNKIFVSQILLNTSLNLLMSKNFLK